MKGDLPQGGIKIEKNEIKRVAVLGAGYMGSAITFPLSDSGHSVNLWGTWLDDDIIASCRKGSHPKLGTPLPDGVKTYLSGDLADAVADVQCVFVGVSSEGFIPVFRKLLETWRDVCPVLCLTKGFVEDRGRVKRISEWAEEVWSSRFDGERFEWISIGGPVKALELSRMIPSASIYGLRGDSTRIIARSVSTPYYRVFPYGDVAGVEISSAFKNAYSIGLGICDGIYKRRNEEEYHNICGFVFNVAIGEMAEIVERAGGDSGAVYGLAGVGDLYVTGRSGRNRRFGELIGTGSTPKDSFEKMMGEGELAEGYDAIAKGVQWYEEEQKGRLDDLPLLKTLHRIVIYGKSPEEEIYSFIEGCGC